MKSSFLALGVVSLALRFLINTVGTAFDHSEYTFGGYLRRELQTRGWTVRYLALRAGVNHSTISRLIQGRSPTLETVRRLQGALTPRSGQAPLNGSHDVWLTDPVKGVAAALARDPLLDDARVQEILRYYLLLRVATPAPDARAHRMPPEATIRRVITRPSADQDALG